MSAAGAGGGELVGGIVGDIWGEPDRRRARRAREAALLDIMNSRPEVDRSAYEDIHTDPSVRLAQVEALQGLQKTAREGGLGVEDRAAYNQAAAETARRERGARGAILQGMASRGAAGSGAELAASLANQQGAAESNAVAGTQAAADARRRTLQARMSSGQLAGGIRGQDWGEASDRAGAQDAISTFNASQRLRRAGMLANTRMGVADQHDADSDRWARRGAGMGAGIGSFIGGN